MDNRAPFPSVEANAHRRRESPGLSLAVGSLLERRDELKAEIDALLEEHRVACEQVPDAENRHKRLEAEAYLRAEGKPVEERKRLALLSESVQVAAGDLSDALSARRIAEKALHAKEKDLECLTALAHAHNRELKVLEG